MASIEITEFTDPTCPFAWSAEPSRRRVEWLYGDALRIVPRMVGLSESPEDQEAKGLSTAHLAKGAWKLSHAHHMPMDTDERPRLYASLPSCRAVVATRLHAPERERAMLRALRVLFFSGTMPDEPVTLRAAAGQAGVESDALERWMAEPGTESALGEDLAAARAPSPAALALAHKLAPDGEGGHRYTCPSWELSRDGRSVAVPGFQPTAAYEVAIANLAPELTRREDPQSVVEVLGWAGEPLASAEVAAVCEIGLDEARQQLGRVAQEQHIGFEGLWSIA